jgi:hypothetical protein
MEAPVELGLRAANRIGIGRRPCRECTDRAVERIFEFSKGVFHRQSAGSSKTADIDQRTNVSMRRAIWQAAGDGNSYFVGDFGASTSAFLIARSLSRIGPNGPSLCACTPKPSM